jgi:palmitoyl-protein thioesterase
MARGAAPALLVVALMAAATAVPSARAARIPATDRLVIAAADAFAADAAASRHPAAANAAASRHPAAANAAASRHPAAANAADDQKPLPIVLWHGMGDSCCALGSIGGVAKFLESRLGVFVHSVATGEGELKDIASSFYGNVNEQVADVCRQLLALKDELKDGFHMVGFSQGGQFLRAVVQRCGHELPGPVHTLISMGAQHMGVSNAPACSRVSGGSGPAAKACAAVESALSLGAYSAWVRDHVVQAQYFKSPSEYDQYLERNVFLPDINNEVEKERSQRYKKNLAALERLVLYRFEDDTVVEPAESSHFGFWDVEGGQEEGAARRIVPLCESRMYKEDWLGLRELDRRGGGAGVCGGGGKASSSGNSSSSGALVLATAPGDHMQFRMRWFEEDVMDRWLAPPPEKGWLARARAAQREAAAAAA